VSILISAYNEAAHIRATIRNKLELRYPGDRLEIIAVSDGSTDGTDQIIQGLRSPQVRYIRQEPRQGKTAALNRAAREASGEILVFSDANSHYDPDALTHLAANFADPTIGYVTGQLHYGCETPSSVGEGCSAYMHYENALRRCETHLGSIVGVNGGIDAVRRSLFRPMRSDQLPDFVLPLSVVEQGYRVVFDPAALSFEHALSDAADEYRMRVRVARRTLAALYDFRHLLNPTRYGLYALQLISHKVLRYAMPGFLIVLYGSSAVLASHGSHIPIFALQTLVYLTALSTLSLKPQHALARLLRFPFYFCLANAAAAHAVCLYFTSDRSVVTWQPRKG